MKKYRLYIPVYCLIALIFIGCDGSDNSNENTFDRSKMLQNMAENLIKPAYKDLESKTKILENAVNTFSSNPDINTLTATQVAWENAYVAWQYANAYNFGPAGEEGIRKTLNEEIGIFPVTTNKIEENIATSNHSFNDFSRDSRGFLAIEYLIFNLENNNNSIITQYADTARRAHLKALTQKLNKQISDVVKEWDSSYTENFIKNNGTDVGSGTAILFNNFVQSFETLKNFKVSLPLGKRAGQIQTEPTKVEAYYSGKSLKMMKNHFQAIENIWYGKDKNGADGIGFKEYLENVEGGNALVASTISQFNSIHTEFNKLQENPRFSAQIQNTPTNLEQLNTELQKSTRFLKSDMSSFLGIAITYASGDGD